MKVSVFWKVMLCCLVDRHMFGGTCTHVGSKFLWIIGMYPSQSLGLSWDSFTPSNFDSVRSVLILSSHLCQCFPSHHFSWRLSNKNVLISCFVMYLCMSHLSPLMWSLQLLILDKASHYDIPVIVLLPIDKSRFSRHFVLTYPETMYMSKTSCICMEFVKRALFHPWISLLSTYVLLISASSHITLNSSVTVTRFLIQ
jgi:hypothetical protein